MAILTIHPALFFPRGLLAGTIRIVERSSIYPRIITSRLRGLIASAESAGPPSCRAGLRAFPHFIYTCIYIYIQGDPISALSPFQVSCNIVDCLRSFMASIPLILVKFYILFDKYASRIAFFAVDEVYLRPSHPYPKRQIDRYTAGGVHKARAALLRI